MNLVLVLLLVAIVLAGVFGPMWSNADQYESNDPDVF